MNLGGFLFFNAFCDAINGVAKKSKCPRRGTPAYNRAAIGSIIAIILWVVTIVLFITTL